MPRRTKIVATLGPAVDDPEIFSELVRLGVDLVRINMSHGSHAQHQRRIEQVREVAQKFDRTVGILLDLQGPKIRIARFSRGSVDLVSGQQFILDAELDPKLGNEKQVGLDYHSLPQEVVASDTLVLDDGRITLNVESVEGSKIICKVVHGGKLSDNKGLNRLGGGLAAAALTDKDKQDLAFGAILGIDYVALSFPKCAEDLHEARRLMASLNCNAQLVAKIERAEALKDLDAIISASDAIMVARGDLGVEIGIAALPAMQKKIIDRANALDKAVITATQMMESMIHSPVPTRAEVSDVANAVLDGTDAVMLSAETASGRYPLEVMSAIAEICEAAEKEPGKPVIRERETTRFTRVDEAIAMAAMYVSNHLDIRAIMALTESGSTPLWMSRVRSNIPIYAMSRHPKTLRKMTLFKGVHPLLFDVTQFARWDVTFNAIKCLAEKGYVAHGDKVLVTKGDILGIGGGANDLKLVTVDFGALKLQKESS